MAAWPKDPWKKFAEWPVGEISYVVDAEGKVWSGSPRGWSRIAGSLAEVKERIISGKLRGGLLRESNPLKRRGSFPKGKTPPHLKKYLFRKGHR